MHDFHALRTALRTLARNPRNLSALRSLLARQPGSVLNAASFSDQRAAAEAESLLKNGRWILLKGKPRPAASGAAPRSQEPEWVAEDDGTTSNDQGLDIRPEAELEEPLSLEFEVEEEPPFSLEIEDATPQEPEPEAEPPEAETGSDGDPEAELTEA